MLITFVLGIPLTIVAAVLNENGFFHEKTVSYVLHNGQLMAAQCRRDAWNWPVRVSPRLVRWRLLAVADPAGSEPIE